MTLPEWQIYISVFKDIVTAAAASIAAIVAVKGLQAWSKQLKGKTEYELARRLLRAVYRVRDAIRAVRNPVQTSEETAAAFKESNEIPTATLLNADLNFKINEAVYQLRWRRVQEAMTDLQVEMLEAEVSWGKEVKLKTDPLHICTRKLYISTRRHLRSLNPRLVEQLDPNAREALDHIIFELDAEGSDETFSNEIRNSIETIEEFLKPHLKL